MIRDRTQKKLAACHCAVQGVVPFVEVIVRSFASVEEAPVDITDIDVLGVEVGHFGRTRRILFDCKTANKQSGVNRAPWALGLRHLVGAEAGFVIQSKAVPDTHRLAASAMGINIHTEDSFRRYATSLSADFARDVTYLDEMDRWDELLLAGRDNAAFADLTFFLSTRAPLELSGPKGIRLGLSALMHAGGELDPGKQLHHMVFGCVLSAFLLHMAMAIAVLKDAFDFSMARGDFEQRLRYFLWEGRENYELRFKLHRALQERAGADGSQITDFDLPEWGKLVELVRGYPEAPEALAPLALIVKEIAFRSATPQPKPDADRRISALLLSSNRARQFIFSATAYLIQATKLPRDFERELETRINELIG
jgi:hypothetical protein